MEKISLKKLQNDNQMNIKCNEKGHSEIEILRLVNRKC